MDKIGSDISSSEDELLTGERIENNYSPIERNIIANQEDIVKDDDQMSLSSLSSNDQKIEETAPNIPPPPIPTQFNPYQYPSKSCTLNHICKNCETVISRSNASYYDKGCALI